MAFFMDPGAMFLGCLGPSEQKFLVTLIETAAKSGYTRFVEPCAGTFAMANLAVQNGFKPEQIETSDVNMMSTVLGYAITGQSLEPLEIHAQGFSDEELLDPATALYAQLYLRTSKNAGNDYFYQILTDLRLRRDEHIESINRQIEVIRNLLGGMSYRPLDMWEHLKEVLDDPHAFGSNAVPGESASVIQQAIKKAEKEGTITSKNRWQLIEYLCADYLSGR